MEIHLSATRFDSNYVDCVARMPTPRRRKNAVAKSITTYPHQNGLLKDADNEYVDYVTQIPMPTRRSSIVSYNIPTFNEHHGHVKKNAEKIVSITKRNTSTPNLSATGTSSLSNDGNNCSEDVGDRVLLGSHKIQSKPVGDMYPTAAALRLRFKERYQRAHHPQPNEIPQPSRETYKDNFLMQRACSLGFLSKEGPLPVMFRMPQCSSTSVYTDLTQAIESVPPYSWIMPYIFACVADDMLSRLRELPSAYDDALGLVVGRNNEAEDSSVGESSDSESGDDDIGIAASGGTWRTTGGESDPYCYESACENLPPKVRCAPQPPSLKLPPRPTLVPSLSSPKATCSSITANVTAYEEVEDPLSKTSWRSLGCMWVCRDPTWSLWETRQVFICDTYLLECDAEGTEIIGFAPLSDAMVKRAQCHKPHSGLDDEECDVSIDGNSDVSFYLKRDRDSMIIDQSSLASGRRTASVASSLPTSLTSSIWTKGNADADSDDEEADGDGDLIGDNFRDEIKVKQRRRWPEMWEALEIICLTNTADNSPRMSIWLRSDDSMFSGTCDDVSSALKLDKLESILRAASAMRIQDAFDFSSDLGKGRYNVVRRGTRRDWLFPSLRSSRQRGSGVGSGACSVPSDRAVKIVAKDTMWARVREGLERPDALVREVLAQILVCHTLRHANDLVTANAHVPEQAILNNEQRASRTVLSTFRSVFDDDPSRMRTPSPMMITNTPPPRSTSASNTIADDLPIVRIFGTIETANEFALELELMQSEDLYDRLASQGVMTEQQAQQITLQLVDAALYCIRHGVAHRDIKLSNVTFPMTSKSSDNCGSPADDIFVKLADFGMAGFLGPDGRLRGRCGTPGFVAPDIIKAEGQETYHMNVDMFSIGVVAYTLLCGYEPFYGENTSALIAANRDVAFDFHMPEWGLISAEAKDFIARALAPTAERRMGPLRAKNHPWLAPAVLRQKAKLDLIQNQLKPAHTDLRVSTGICSVTLASAGADGQYNRTIASGAVKSEGD